MILLLCIFELFLQYCCTLFSQPKRTELIRIFFYIFAVSRSEIVTTVCIDLDYNDCCHFPVEGTSFSIGTLVLLPWDTWSAVQRKLKMLFTTYVSHMDLGLKTKKTNRLDPEASTDYIQYSLGLTENSIAHFVIGNNYKNHSIFQLCATCSW